MTTYVTCEQFAMPCRLNPGEIHIWHARLEQLYATAEALASTLSPDERDTANRFRFDRDRNRYAMSRGILRRLLGAYLDVPAASLQFSYNQYGKPYLAGESLPHPIHFNLSHSCGLVLFAFSRDQEVGIDLERIRMDFDFENIAKTILPADGLAELFSLPGAERFTKFFQLWTRIEAWAKAQGIGASLLDGARTLSQRGDDSVWRTIYIPSGEFLNWKIEEFAPEPDYVASVASTFAATSLKHWEYPNSLD
jgi:4'-phosphopantetheinyl transferase